MIILSIMELIKSSKALLLFVLILASAFSLEGQANYQAEESSLKSIFSASSHSPQPYDLFIEFVNPDLLNDDSIAFSHFFSIESATSLIQNNNLIISLLLNELHIALPPPAIA